MKEQQRYSKDADTDIKIQQRYRYKDTAKIRQRGTKDTLKIHQRYSKDIARIEVFRLVQSQQKSV